jgi:glycosyltransferase involved in cell wall biosynthesis
MTILIPSYEPDQRLVNLILQLKDLSDEEIIVVDDGSGEQYREIFKSVAQFGSTVLHHDTNRGKGRALKTGFLYLKEKSEQGSVVCADSDGQHLPADIIRISQALGDPVQQILLGSRHFSGKVPFRSRFGNMITTMVYSFTTGNKVQDTQTGLRGYSSHMLDWLCQIPGERFEYEMNMLLGAQREGISIHEIFIDTVYLEHNKSSHFRPLVDSIRVYLPIILFSGSSILSGILDFILLILIQHLSANLFLSVLIARICSSVFNYTVNRRFVFSHNKRSNLYSSLPKYFTLVIIVFLLNYGLLHIYHIEIGMSLIFSKLLTEASIFLFSFWAQRKYVY